MIDWVDERLNEWARWCKDGVNLDINHALSRRCASVTVFADASPTYESQQLFNTAAYNGIINIDSNNNKIQSLSNINKIIYINILFEI